MFGIDVEYAEEPMFLLGILWFMFTHGQIWAVCACGRLKSQVPWILFVFCTEKETSMPMGTHA